MPVRLHRRDLLRALLAAGGALSARPRGWAQELLLLPPVETPASLRLLFFNTHLLPTIAQAVAGRRGQDDYRTAAIAAQLHAFDLVGLCEVFEARRRREIVRIVQENSNDAFAAIEQPKPWGRHIVGSGLLLLTRYPLVGEPHFLTYREASRVLSTGWRADGFAAKGAIHARLQLGNSPDAAVDCFLTHLESVSRTARAAQIKELSEFVAAHTHPDRPAILMGDLNVAADYPLNIGSTATEYGEMASTIRCGDRPFVDLWPALHSERGGTSDPQAPDASRRIDYVFMSPPSATGPQLRVTSMRIEPFLDEKMKKGSLSDHAALQCTFTLQ